MLRGPVSTMVLDSAAEVTQESRVGLPELARRSPASAADVGPELAWLAYREHFDSVWRLLRRLGVPEHKLDDSVQDVFMTVHRRAREFRGESQLRTWVLGIAVRVAANVRRSARREVQRETALPEELISPVQPPDEAAARRQAVHTLHRLLSRLDEAHRELFVLVDLEQLSVPVAADLLGLNASTCYKRLDVARARFNAELEHERALDERRLR